MSYTRGEDRVQVHFIQREVPIYKTYWTFCPYCGVKWVGPVRCDDPYNNERMLGPKRRAIHEKVRERRSGEGWKSTETTTFWWVLQERTVWAEPRMNGIREEDWENKNYARGLVMPAAKMLYLKREHQERLDADNKGWDLCHYETRLITVHKEPSGYEIRNYDWEPQ